VRATIALWIALCFTILVGTGPALAGDSAPVDAGLAVSIVGEVTVDGCGGGAAQSATPFMKIRVGDVLQLAEGATVALVFFESGIRESWSGPDTLEIGEQGATSEAEGAPTTEEVGGMVGRSLESLPGILRRAEIDMAGQRKIRGSAGGQVGLDEVEQAQLAEARETYARMSAAATGEDILAEMYFASVLLSFGLDDEARSVLDQAVTKCGECETPRSLLGWLDTRRAEGD